MLTVSLNSMMRIEKTLFCKEFKNYAKGDRKRSGDYHVVDIFSSRHLCIRGHRRYQANQASIIMLNLS